MKALTRFAAALTVAAVALAGRPAQAQQPAPDDATRYAALGDSVAAGFKAQPATRGYTYLLYENGAFDSLPHTLFNNLSSVGATSKHVLDHQVPQVLISGLEGGFQPDYVTLTVGGNDAAAIQRYAATNPSPTDLAIFIQNTVNKYAQNLGAIFLALTTALPNVKIFVGNHYSVPEIEALLPGADLVLAAFNQTVQAAAAPFAGRVHVVDVYSAFLDRQGLLLIDRRSASLFEVHLTNAGHRVMAQAFADSIAENK
jgi:lysophospholipase L1-like esterase